MATHPPNPPAADPGRTLGTVGLVLAIIPCTYVIGLILSVVGWVQSNKVGIRNQRALAGIIVGVVYLVLSIIGQVTGFFTGLFR